jgi:chromate transporter
VERGWATERQFAESLAVGQIAPGPTGLWVISLGYLLDGMRGAGLALAAISLPPLLILGVERLYRHVQQHAAVEGFVRGLSLSVVGVFVVALYNLLRGVGLDAQSLLFALAAVGLGLSRKVPILMVVLLAALAGVVLG